MTEHVVKEIGRLWIVYADRVSIAACELVRVPAAFGGHLLPPWPFQADRA
jgi:hypothetical protein